MADPNRQSGRQPAARTSGRTVAATGSSGRLQPASARVPAQPAPAAPVRAPSARVAASGRAPATQSSRQHMAPAAARSSRRVVEAEPAKPRKKTRAVKKEVLIAFSGVAILMIVAAVVYVTKTKKITEAEQIKKQRTEIRERNFALGEATFQKAYQAGVLFVKGKEKHDPEVKELPDALKSKLFLPFQNDEKVHNVIYEWDYKTKQQKSKKNQQAMDPSRMRVEKMDVGMQTNDGVAINYGFVDNKSTPIVMASKRIPPDAGDTANEGGTITIIVKAEKDEVFEKALQPKAAPEAEKKDETKK